MGAAAIQHQVPARILARRMKTKDFQDPAKLPKPITRYVAMADQQNQSSAAMAMSRAFW